jgi:hypothetical protein
MIRIFHVLMAFILFILTNIFIYAQLHSKRRGSNMLTVTTEI